MYICNNCGNIEKFIGYVQEEGKALIYQNGSRNDLSQAGDTENLSKTNTVYAECVSENISWAYFLSDKDWKSSLELKKCCYCNSSDIIWH